MLEVFYKIYFKLAAIRPLGAIDLTIRRWFGILFNDAASRSQLKIIRTLAEFRQSAIDQIIRFASISHDQYPCIDIVVAADAQISTVAEVLAGLKQQSYPGNKISLTVLLFESQPADEIPPLPECFLQARYLTVASSNSSTAMTAAVSGHDAPYMLFLTSLLKLEKHSLEEVMSSCISSPTDVGLWEISPTLSTRTGYYDPVSLDISSSGFECVVIRRKSFDAVKGFDEQLPAAEQGRDFSLRLRENGFRLKNIGLTELFKQIARSKILPVKGNHEIPLGSAIESESPDPVDGPKVTIIIRTFSGRDHWLRESVCSVVNQTFANIELIVVEDGSTEHKAFLRAVSASMREGHTLKYLTQKKAGKSQAGNLGLASAEGDYIGFLDDDDLLFANHVELLLKAVLQDSMAVGAYSQAWEVQTSVESGQVYDEEHFEVPEINRQVFSRKALEKHNFLPIQSVLFERSLYEEYGGFETDRVFLEDWELWLRYTQDAGFAYLPHITSIYRTPADPYERIARVSHSSRRSVGYKA